MCDCKNCPIVEEIFQLHEKITAHTTKVLPNSTQQKQPAETLPEHEKQEVNSELESLFFSALELQMFIEQTRKENPLLWAVNNKTPVVELDTYKRACKNIKDIGISLGYDKCFIP